MTAGRSAEELWRPFRTGMMGGTVSPGRCPGLYCFRLSGGMPWAVLDPSRTPGWLEQAPDLGLKPDNRLGFAHAEEAARGIGGRRDDLQDGAVSGQIRVEHPIGRGQVIVALDGVALAVDRAEREAKVAPAVCGVE